MLFVIYYLDKCDVTACCLKCTGNLKIIITSMRKNYICCHLNTTLNIWLQVQFMHCFVYKRGNLSCSFEALPCNHFFSGNVVSITYSELPSVTVAIQHAKGERHILFSSVTSPAVPTIFSLFNIRHDFPKTTHWTLNVCFDYVYKCRRTYFAI